MSSERKPFLDAEEETTNVGSEPEKSVPDFTLSGIENLEIDFAHTLSEITNPLTKKTSISEPGLSHASETEASHEPPPPQEADSSDDGERTFVSPGRAETKENEVAKTFDEATRIMASPFAGLRKTEEDTARLADETTDKVTDKFQRPFPITSQHSNPAIEKLAEEDPISRLSLSKAKILLVTAIAVGVLGVAYVALQPEDAPQTEIATDQPSASPATPIDPQPQPATKAQASQVETLLYQFHTLFHKTQTQAHRKNSP